MTNNLYYLHGKPRKIAQFTRVEFSEHRQVEYLLSAGKRPVNRFVIEAANYMHQSSPIHALRDENTEIVLDTNIAALSTKGCGIGAVRDVPWASYRSGSSWRAKRKCARAARIKGVLEAEGQPRE